MGCVTKAVMIIKSISKSNTGQGRSSVGVKGLWANGSSRPHSDSLSVHQLGTRGPELLYRARRGAGVKAPATQALFAWIVDVRPCVFLAAESMNPRRRHRLGFGRGG